MPSLSDYINSSTYPAMRIDIDENCPSILAH